MEGLVFRSKILLLFDELLMFFSNLFAEIGIYFFNPLLLSSDLVIVDIPYLDIIERPYACCKLNGLLLIRPRRPLDLKFRGNGVKAKPCEKLLSFLS